MDDVATVWSHMCFPSLRASLAGRGRRASHLLLVGMLGCLALSAPARAQQEVALTGQVTDPGGQPVQGVFVFLQRQPGFVFVQGHTTRSDGSYTLSVAPGTYRLNVSPNRGPFVPQIIENFALPGSTRRDFVLATGVTLSGRITDSTGAPVAQAFVNVVDVRQPTHQQVSFVSTDNNGQYSIGVPPGTYRVSVFSDGRFIERRLDDVPLNSDVRLDITLQSGMRLEGLVVDERGQPVTGVAVQADDLAVGCCPDFFFTTRADGAFRFSVPPAVYILRANPLPPRHPTRLRVDARGGNVTGLVLQVSAQPAAFVPDVPPRAGLLQVSPPDAAGDVTITGAPGALPASSAVVLMTLDTGHYTVATAGADGSVRASLFAPAGTAILVKADPLGSNVDRFVRDNTEELLRQGDALAALPGTILHVADPPASGAEIAFGGAGLTHFARIGESPLPAWTFQGTLSSQVLAAGGTLRVRGTLSIVSPALAGAGAMQAGTNLSLERLSAPDGLGTMAINTYASVFLTPTGLPIERQPRCCNEGLDQFVFLPITRVAADRAEAVVDMTLQLPATLLEGYYRPVIHFNFAGVPVEFPPGRPVASVDRAQRRPVNRLYLPVVRLGNPAAPRLYWTLLTDTLSNGTRGVRAIEDRGRFGVASRILTQSETFIVPRLDPASGQPLTYRLEPFAPTVSLGDQVPPNPPRIPFRFPSGRLTVRVQRPDGAVDVLGPAPFVQARVKSLVKPEDGSTLDAGGGHITDVYELSTLEPRFEVQFTQDGRHIITLDGHVEDVWGNVWTGGGTYEVHVARLLSLDTAVLPGMHFEVGDVLDPGLVLTPAVPADVEARFRLVPLSDTGQRRERTVTGRANRFGYFHPPASGIALDQPGEYRLDVTASYRDEQGQLWMGTRTWGGVVASRNPAIVAHGRRGVDDQPSIGPQWFFRTQTGIEIGGSHVPFPFNSGDIQWLQKSDAAIPLVAFQDLGGALVPLIRARGFDASGRFFNFPLNGPGGFDERASVGELPLFSSRPERLDAHLDPARVDLWGYSYRSVQRPLVRVREEISEDQIPPPYWRFNERYAGQLGVGPGSDLPNEIKFEYTAVVLRGPALDQPHYALHGALFVLVPDDDPGGGTRTFPPFQGNGGGPSGGPIMTLRGRDIDLFLHLTGVRPGSILEVGNTFALAGAVGPPLPALVRYAVTDPDGQRRDFAGRANRVGYYYRPADDFVVERPGLYTVDLTVIYDGATSAGQVTAPLPSGDVLGTAAGRFVVYVVPPGSPLLSVDQPRTAFLPPPAQFEVNASPPDGMRLTSGHVTAMIPGFLLHTGDLASAGGRLAYRYDPVSLAREISVLDVERFGTPQAVDVVTLNLFATGTHEDGSPAFAARTLVLHGQELLNLGRTTDSATTTAAAAAVLPTSRSVQVGTPATVFATVLNVGATPVTGVGIALRTAVPAGFLFQATDSRTNVVTGGLNTPVDIAAGSGQSFVLALTPTASFDTTQVEFTFQGVNMDPVRTIPGVNTLLLSAATEPVPDIVALAATLNNDGIVQLASSSGMGVFAVATVNVGASGTLSASADTGGVSLPVRLTLCETNPGSGACVAAPADSVTTRIDARATPTFGVFVAGSGGVPFDPAVNRIFVRFRDAGGVVRGATSVAVRSQ